MNDRIVDTVTRVPLRGSRTVSTLGLSDSSLPLVLNVSWRWPSVDSWVVSCLHVEAPLVLLLLKKHLLLNLLLMHLLSRGQVEVVNYIRDIGHSIIVLSITDLTNSAFPSAVACLVLRVDNTL